MATTREPVSPPVVMYMTNHVSPTRCSSFQATDGAMLVKMVPAGEEPPFATPGAALAEAAEGGLEEGRTGVGRHGFILLRRDRLSAMNGHQP